MTVAQAQSVAQPEPRAEVEAVSPASAASPAGFDLTAVAFASFSTAQSSTGDTAARKKTARPVF